MKHKINKLTALTVLVLLMSCTGPPESEYSPDSTSLLFTQNMVELMYNSLDPGKISATVEGSWEYHYGKTELRSRLVFDPEGTFREMILPSAGTQPVAVQRGIYSIDENRLNILLDNGDLFRFDFYVNAVSLVMKNRTAELSVKNILN